MYELKKKIISSAPEDAQKATRNMVMFCFPTGDLSTVEP